jgi:Flp pilus assembly protein TadB
MRMRQSMAQLEREFEQESVIERRRRRDLRRTALQRTRMRRRAKLEQSQKLRFVLLMLAIAATVVGVTVAMFETLAWLMG